MKRFLSVLLSICLLILFCSCNDNGVSSLEELEVDEPSKKTEEPSKKTEEPIDEEQIKKTVMQLMEHSEMQESPASLFSYFDGDYEISDFARSNIGINSVKRKNNASLVSTYGVKYYGVEASSSLFYVSENGGYYDFLGFVPLHANVGQKSTIFTAFGIDTSVIYGTEDEEYDEIALTEKMLTVSKDGKTCTFSKDYIDEMVKIICEELEFTDEQKDTFLDKYEGSGVYSVKDNKITFDIKLEDATLGNIRETVSYSIDKDGKVNYSTFAEYSNPSIGIDYPYSIEINYNNVLYKDNKPVSAVIQYKTTEDYSYYEGSALVKATATVSSTFRLDLSDAQHPYATALKQTTQEESYKGQTWTYRSQVNVTVDLGKATSQFTFSQNEDGETVTSLVADKVKFSTPYDFPTVPQGVLDCITNYINSNFQ